MDLTECKRTEFAHQERKYAGVTRIPTISIPGFTQSHLRPAHKGGQARGELFRRAIAALPETRGLRVLDYACGRGHLGIYLALCGAKVSAIDVSPAAVDIANKSAKLSGVTIDAQVMDCENLEYGDGEFDLIVGFEALHHVIVYPRTPTEIGRVLKPGGYAVFAENWGGDNPLFRLWRSRKMAAAHCDARGEVILSEALLVSRFASMFSIDVQPFSITYMAKKKINSKALLSVLYAIDKPLEALFPSMCGESVVTLRRSDRIAQKHIVNSDRQGINDSCNPITRQSVSLPPTAG